MFRSAHGLARISSVALIAVGFLVVSGAGASPASAFCGVLQKPVKPNYMKRTGGFQGTCEDELNASEQNFMKVQVKYKAISSTEACAKVEVAKQGDFGNESCTEEVGNEKGEYVIIALPKCTEKEEEEEVKRPRVPAALRAPFRGGGPSSDVSLESFGSGESGVFGALAALVAL